jgi:hypothetical protein
MARLDLHGATNILPDPQVGAEALIFINSPCFNGGPIATSLERSGQPK